MENMTMLIDYYEFTMGQTYFDKGEVNKKVYFDIFFRKNPFNGGYTISGGLDRIVEYIKNFSFTDEDIKFLKRKGNFSEDYLGYLRNLRFTGDIYAIPDGTVVFPNEPIITVRANIIEAQLIETALLLYFNSASLYTTASKRITEAAQNRPVMEFGARRGRGDEATVEASKYAYIGGCVGTSNCKGAEKYDIPFLGTMAHSMISDMGDEYEAFLNYAKSNPGECTFLVDTYNTLKSGVPNAIKVANDYLKPNNIPFKGIRIDSGDLAYLSKEARKMLDEAGYPNAKICLSNGLNEQTIKSLIEQGACVDSFGVGDNIAAANDIVGGVYKLVGVEEDGIIKPRIKVSDTKEKTINPHYKKVYRFYDKTTGYALGDVIAVHDEVIPTDKYVLVNPNDEFKTTTITNYSIRQLQMPIFINGELVYNVPTITQRKKYCEEEFKRIYPEIKRSLNPHQYYVDLSLKLLKLKKELILGSVNNKDVKRRVKK